jgi:hypothetical protein
MSNFDDPNMKSLDAKLSAFYKQWDSITDEDKIESFRKIKEAMNQLDQMDLASLSEESRQELIEKVEKCKTMISDLEIAIGHRLWAFTVEFSENVKKAAESGDPKAMELWEKMKDEYYKAKYSGLADN